MLLDTKINFTHPEHLVSKAPHLIKAKYSEDLNIIKIHDMIRDIFAYYSSNEKKIMKEIDELYKNGNTADPLDKVVIMNKISEIKNKIKRYSIKSWYIYVDKTQNLLEKYSQVSSKKKKRKLLGSNNDNSNQDRDITERISIIKKYLGICNDYVQLDIIFENPMKMGCPTCGILLNEMTIDEDQGIYACDCGDIFGHVYSNETSHKDPEKIETSIKNNYDDKTNFIRRLNSFQGIQTRRINDKLLDTLDNYFKKNCGLPLSSQIKEMPLDRYGHRCDKTSIQLLEDGLRNTGNSSHFQDINMISYELWGWKVPDINHLVPQIISHYSMLQELFRKNKPEGSSLNVELRLYWHLKLVGYDCKLEDFKIPSSTESKKRNSEIFKSMCEESGLPFFPII